MAIELPGLAVSHLNDGGAPIDVFEFRDHLIGDCERSRSFTQIRAEDVREGLA